MPEKLTACRECAFYTHHEMARCGATTHKAFDCFAGEWIDVHPFHWRLNTDGHCPHWKERKDAKQ